MPTDTNRIPNDTNIGISMDQFLAWLSRMFDTWKFWIVISPWEIGVRVRLGKNATAMSAGFHFRVPFVDAITLVNTRLRIDGTPPVTVHGSAPNLTRYISATVAYRVSDPLKAMLNFGIPQAVVVSKMTDRIIDGMAILFIACAITYVVFTCAIVASFIINCFRK
jgi:hypothetical protein